METVITFVCGGVVGFLVGKALAHAQDSVDIINMLEEQQCDLKAFEAQIDRLRRIGRP